MSQLPGLAEVVVSTVESDLRLPPSCSSQTGTAERDTVSGSTDLANKVIARVLVDRPGEALLAPRSMTACAQA